MRLTVVTKFKILTELNGYYGLPKNRRERVIMYLLGFREVNLNICALGWRKVPRYLEASMAARAKKLIGNINAA